ncbi:aquaporin-4-like isoform X2 [Dunckerocampus dactyliophorus]|uniref:aquaporin-4-like isoform X2 n=1 Tax=Dunckerocampus dactyliophorus TaxID=161453 RepID=UPI0024052561|nr:aquaporin-4-like isoform X2 [Dunckerocampus dactyliophorus]
METAYAVLSDCSQLIGCVGAGLAAISRHEDAVDGEGERKCETDVFTHRRCCFPCRMPHRPQRPPSCIADAMTAFKGIWTQEFWRCVGAEFLAMLFFVLLGLGSTINWGAAEGDPQLPDLAHISLCFGLTIGTMVQCFGHISGAHINPAVTAAMVVTRKLSVAKAVFYVLAQCLGSIVGAAVLYGVTPASVRGGMGVTAVNKNLSVGNALVVEILISFQLIFTVFATCDHKRSDLKGSSALAIGLSVCVGHLFAIPYTGASMNPARSLGPAVITWSWENHWVYWVGPALGGSVAAALYEYLFCPDPEAKKRYSDSFIKAPFMGSKQRQNSVTAQEPLFGAMEAERADRKERDREREVSGEVLSSV